MERNSSVTITAPEIRETDIADPDISELEVAAQEAEPESEPDTEQQAKAEACAWWQRRLTRLTEAWQGVCSERDLAMYRLHQHGLSVAAIGRLAEESPDVVADIVLSAARDDNMAYFPPGPIWIEFWPSYDPAPAKCFPTPPEGD